MLRKITWMLSGAIQTLAMIMLVWLIGCSGKCDMPNRGEYILEMCGPKPATPGLVVFLDKGQAILSVENYIEVRNSMEQMSNWMFCASELD